MKAGPAALCNGKVWHRRNYPAVNQFSYDVSHIWIDPDQPDELTDQHPLWSSTRMAPGRIRRSDYGTIAEGSLASQVRSALTPVLGYRPTGAVRMLSQPRRWGWMFNPITVFVAWHSDPDRPVGAIAEVTNTPWKERTQYPVALTTADDVTWSTEFDKTLHVSPFLDEDYRYRLSITDDAPELEIRIDVLDRDNQQPIVETALRVGRERPTASALGRALTRGALSTRTVSFAIHAQAARLAAKGVPFVPHPRKRRPSQGELSH